MWHWCNLVPTVVCYVWSFSCLWSATIDQSFSCSHNMQHCALLVSCKLINQPSFLWTLSHSAKHTCSFCKSFSLLFFTYCKETCTRHSSGICFRYPLVYGDTLRGRRRSLKSMCLMAPSQEQLNPDPRAHTHLGNALCSLWDAGTQTSKFNWFEFLWLYNTQQQQNLPRNKDLLAPHFPASLIFWKQQILLPVLPVKETTFSMKAGIRTQPHMSALYAGSCPCFDKLVWHFQPWRGVGEVTADFGLHGTAFWSLTLTSAVKKSAWLMYKEIIEGRK